jgi:hypothetical protein
MEHYQYYPTSISLSRSPLLKKFLQTEAANKSALLHSNRLKSHHCSTTPKKQKKRDALK